MIKNFFNVEVGNEVISGVILSNDNILIKPKFVFLHGAGIGVKEMIYNVSAPILNSGSNILSIDFSGHGESSGELKKSSLQKRVIEAKASIDKFSPNGPLIVCGASMGGYIAIRMLELYEIETLILFCPALYGAKAYAVPFDCGFSEIIRSPNSWQNTDVLGLLENFSGKLLIIMGENDEVIPPGVIELINKHTPKAIKKEIYIIPNCPHRVNVWLNDQLQELSKLQSKFLEYL